ncbi:hypothetical protein [Janibacter sp. G1551]|uniref:hypothetical protein n=1 Tax=Janibacter sp. G1551 TaxID=3420440 RepID=UPI003D005801
MPSQDWDERHEAELIHCRSVTRDLIPDVGVRTHYSLPAREGERLGIEALLVRREDPTLIVVFHGALVRRQVTLPRFEWLRTLQERPESLLFIADTTLDVSETLPLAWYVGTEDDNLTDRLTEKIQHVAQLVEAETVCLTGSSGGGFAALAQAARIPGSLAVPFSPQTRIGSYLPMPIKMFRKACFPSYTDYDDVEEHFRTRVDLTHLYRGQTPAWIHYSQNVQDTDHIDAHMEPFLTSLGVDPTTGDGNPMVRVTMDDFGEDHTPPRPRQMRSHLDAALQWHRQQTAPPRPPEGGLKAAGRKLRLPLRGR